MLSLNRYLIIAFTFLLFSMNVNAAQISKQSAINLAQQQHTGRVLSVKLKGEYYKVKIISSSGQIRVISIKANSN